MSDALPDVYKIVIYLKDKTTVTTETINVESTMNAMREMCDSFYRRGLFRRVNSIMQLNGEPMVCIPIYHINFYTIQKKQS